MSELEDLETAAASSRLDPASLREGAQNDGTRARRGSADLRGALHAVADLLADAIEHRNATAPVARSAATPRARRRRGVRVVPPVTLVPDEIAAQRARHAWRRAGLVKVR